jgi:hypothetical protein
VIKSNQEDSDLEKPALMRAKLNKIKEYGGGLSAKIRVEVLYESEKILKWLSSRKQLTVKFKHFLAYAFSCGKCSNRKALLK